MSETPEQGQSGQRGGGGRRPRRHRLRRWAAVAQRRAMQRRALLLLWLGTLALMVVVLALAAVAYLEGPQWHEQVRRFAVGQLERSTGGRVELERVDWSLPRLELDLWGLRIHGTEAASEPPLLQLDEARIQLKWNELLEGRFVLRTLRLARPRVRVVVYPDGATNLPARRRAANPAAAMENLLALAADRVELDDGELDWNDRKIRLDGAASGVSVRLGYQPSDQHYEGQLRVGKIELRLPQRQMLSLGAEGRFRLYRNRVDVSRLRIHERDGWLELSGAIHGLASPVARFAYRASCEANELARLERIGHLQGGTLRASGEGSYRFAGGVYALTGKMQAAQVGWTQPGMRLEGISGGMNFSLRPGELNVGNLFAVALGGAVHGSLQLSSPARGEQQGRLRLQLEGVELERTLEAFSSPRLPLRRLPLAASTRGTLDVSWRGALRNARIEADLHMSPLYRSGRLALSAAVQATANLPAGAVEVRSLKASTPFTRLSGQGRLSRDSDFNFDLEASSLAELEPMVVSWRGSRAQDLPIDFTGRASFRGSVRGSLASPVLAGHLELHNFTTNVSLPSLRAQGKPAGRRAQSAEARRLRMHWDLLQGDVEYSQQGESIRNGLLRRGQTSIALDAHVGLAQGAYDRQLPFSAHLKLQDVPARSLQKMAGSNYPVSGTVNGELALSGGNGSLRGSGRVALHDGEAWRQTVRSATAEIDLHDDEVRLHNIAVAAEGAQLHGEARWNAASHAFAFDLRGTQINLAQLHAPAARRVAVRGRASFELTGKGTPASPEINGHLHLADFAVGKKKFGAMDVNAVTHGAEMTLTASSQFAGMDLKAGGELHLRDDLPMRLSGELHSTHLDSLLAGYLPVRLGGASELAAHFELSGEAMHPRDLAAKITVNRFAASYGGIAVTNEAPVQLTMENRVLRIVDLRLSSEQGMRILRVRGELHLDGSRAIDVRADGGVNLKLLESADPDLMASGTASLNMRVTGSLGRPMVHGRLNVHDGAIAYIDFPSGLSDINGSLIFNEDRLQVQELTARAGGGLLHCSGFLNYVPSQGIGFNLTARGKDIRLRYPRGLSSTADANLMLSGTLKYALLSGDITVTRLAVNQRFDFASYLMKQKRGEPAQTTESPLSKVRLDVHVTSNPELDVQTSLARLSGNLDLRVRGTAFRPVVLGRVNLLEGTLEFNGTKYKMERGDVTFTNPVRIEPTLDVELSTRVRDYDLTLGLHGTLNKLTTTYRSDPPLSSSDIISLLALGRTAEEQANPAMMGTAEYQPTVSESASMALLGQALNATVSSRVQKLFGVSRVKIDPNVGGAVNTSLARVTVEQQISNKLTLTYITNLNQSAQQIIQFEYNLQKNVTIVGVRDQTGVVSFDVVLRKRIK